MIRLATKDDIGRIAEILVFAKRMAYHHIFNDEKTSFNKITVLNTIEKLKKGNLIDRIFVYETDEVIKAVAIYEIDGEWFHFKELYVDPCFQNNVVGSRLAFYVLNYAKEQGFKKVYAWVLELNAYARNCYEKFGAKFNGEKKEFDSTGRYLLKYEIDL